jgi:hypothetical protein
MTKNVRLVYEFEFDPSKLWSHKSDFDKALADFFSAYRIEAEFVEYIGSPNMSVLKLEKMQFIEPPKPPKKMDEEKKMKQVFSDLKVKPLNLKKR